MARDVLDRVRKLLALASSPNVHEAAAAAAAAQALIEAHRLEGLLAEEGREDEDPVGEELLSSSRRLRRWKAVLAQGLAGANGCLIYTRQAGKQREIVVVGRSADRAAVRSLFDWLERQLAWLSATHGAGQSKQWHDDFRVGASGTVVARLGEAAAAQRAALTEAALVRVEPALAAREARVQRYADDTLRLKRGRSVRVDPDAWERGRAAGHAVELGGAVRGGGGKPRS